MSDVSSTSATFEVEFDVVDGLLAGTGRRNFNKTWSGGIVGTSQGVMLSAGDPVAGQAGYVALESFTGSIDGRSGDIVLQQFGVMRGAGYQPELRYEVVPGSGTNGLTGMTGVVELDVVDGVHQVTLRYNTPT